MIKNSKENKSWIGTWPSVGNEEPTIELLKDVEEMQEYVNSLVCPICCNNRSIVCMIIDNRNNECGGIQLVLQCQLSGVHHKKQYNIRLQEILICKTVFDLSIDDIIKEYLQEYIMDTEN